MTPAQGLNQNGIWRKSSYSGDGPDCVEVSVTEPVHVGGRVSRQRRLCTS
ncbi:DUF397 domain-containing protein [Actinoallomurus spadix]